MRAMWKQIGSVVLGTVVTLALAGAANATSVTNGDLETDELNPLIYFPSAAGAPGVFATNAPAWIGLSTSGVNAVAQVLRGFNPTFAFDDNSLWATVGDAGSGVANIFDVAPENAPAQRFDVDLYIIGGSVAVGLTRDAGTTVQQVISLTHQWVHVSGVVPADPEGLHNIFFAVGDGGGASFFVDNLTVSAIPEPGTAMLAGLGLAGLALAGRRKTA